MLLAAPWGGVIADRLNKRRLMYVTQSMSGLLALAFGILVATKLISMWQVYLLAAALGVVNVFDTPARQSFIPELVPVDQLRNAVTLNSITVNLARIAGGAAGGAIAAVLGLALCFDLNALSFVAVLVSLGMMTVANISAPVPPPRARGEIRAGLQYVRSNPRLLVPLAMIAVVGTFAWEFQVSLPLLSQRTFGGGAGTYGTMTAFMGMGAVIGGLISAPRQQARTESLAVSAIGWGVAITCAAFAPTLATNYIAMLFVGYGSITFNSTAKTTLQMVAEPQMRGRVMALWALAWLGSTPVGGPIVGLVGAHLGARWSLCIGGISALAAGVIAYPILRRLEPDHVRAKARRSVRRS
jgi:MFS family permease